MQGKILINTIIHSFCLRNSFSPPVLATPAPSQSSSSLLLRSLPSCPLSFTTIMISTAFLILCLCFAPIDGPCSVEVGYCCLAMSALIPCSFAAAIELPTGARLCRASTVPALLQTPPSFSLACHSSASPAQSTTLCSLPPLDSAVHSCTPSAHSSDTRCSSPSNSHAAHKCYAAFISQQKMTAHGLG